MTDNNKYQKWYDQLISRARVNYGPIIHKYKRRKGFERHHIVPKCVGGSDDYSNLVWLKHREHVMAHMLLPRFVVTDQPGRLWYALWGMVNTNGVKVNSRLYESIRMEAFSRRHKDSNWKTNNIIGARKRVQTQSWKQNHTEAMRNRSKDPIWKKTIKQHWIKTYKQPEYRANRILGMILGRKRPCKWATPEKSSRWYKPKPYAPPREGLMIILANEEKYGSAKADLALALLSY